MEQPKLQGGAPVAEGQGPTLKGPQLARELERMHIDLEMQPVEQNPDKPRDKNSGRTTLPDNLMENEMNNPTTENPNTSTPASSYASPEDRVVSQLQALNAKFTPRKTWHVAAGIGAGAVLGVGIVTVGVYAGTRLATRASAPRAAK